MDMTRVTILDRNIDDKFWPELILAIIYVKNRRPIKVLQSLSPHKSLTQDYLNIFHLRILGSSVYVFLHKEEQSLKLEKQVLRALKRTLVGYNSYIIYQVYINKQNKVIRVKDLQIFEDYKSKTATNLPTYNEDILTFQRFLLEDDNDNDKKESIQVRKSQKVSVEKSCESQKVNTKQFCKGLKVNTEEMHHITFTHKKSRKVKTAEYILSISMSHTSRLDRTVKLSVKAQKVKNIADQKYLSRTKQRSEIEMHKQLSPSI